MTTVQQKVNFKPRTDIYTVPDTTNQVTYPPHTGGGQTVALNKDTCLFSGDISADLVFNPDKSVSGTVYDGTINCKKTTLKIIDQDEDLPLYYEGEIGKKKIKLASCKNEYVGKYGDKKFHLNVQYNEPSRLNYFYNHTILGKSFKPDYFIVKGKFGDEEINLKLPDVKTPKDKDVKDILSLLLFSNGLEARTFDDKIVTLDYSTLRRSDIRKSKKRRTQMYNEDIKPLISQAISTASGIIIGAVMTALLGKLKLKKIERG